MRQLGLFEYQDLKEFTKWDSGCEISEEEGTSTGQNSGCEISGEGGASAGWNSGCDMSEWNVGGEEFRM